MSHRHNYSKYSEQPKLKSTIDIVNDTEVDPVVIVKPIVETEEIQDSADELVNDEIIDQPISENVEKQESESIIGIVSNTQKLRVRKEANVDSEILYIIEKDTEINIDLKNSAEFFYKIVTPAGVEGYCMKEYITIK